MLFKCFYFLPNCATLVWVMRSSFIYLFCTISCCVILHPGYTARLCWLSDIFMTHDVAFMQSLCIMIIIYALHYSFLARGKHLHCIRRWVHVAARMRRRKMLTTPKSVLPQKHLAEFKRKAEDNKQIPCFIYSFLNTTLNPSENKLPEWKASSSNLFRSILPQFSTGCFWDWFSPACEVALLWE